MTATGPWVDCSECLEALPNDIVHIVDHHAHSCPRRPFVWKGYRNGRAQVEPTVYAAGAGAR